MTRSWLAVLACFAFSGLSCSIFAPRTDSTDSLPAVSAEPPASAPTSARREAEIASIAAALTARATGLTPVEVDQVARTVVGEAHRHKLEPSLVMAVMHVESRYYNFAVSPVGAIGLMQVMPETGEELASRLGIRWLGPQTLFEPTTNVRLGVAYLRELSDRYGSLSTALAAYNWGPGRIDRRLRLGADMPAEYSSLVLQAYAAGRGRS
jgi:soluble lytic murein transglycosylase-like protein